MNTKMMSIFAILIVMISAIPGLADDRITTELSAETDLDVSTTSSSRSTSLRVADDDFIERQLDHPLRQKAIAAETFERCIAIIRSEKRALLQADAEAICRGLKEDWRKSVFKQAVKRVVTSTSTSSSSSTTMIRKGDNACVRIKESKEVDGEVSERVREFCSKTDAMPQDVRERLQKMSEAHQERIAKLSERYLERLSDLDEKNFDKIAKLREERIRKLTASLEGDALNTVANELTEEELDKFSLLTRAQIRELAQTDSINIRQRLALMEIKHLDAENRLHLARTLAEEKMKKARERYAQAMDRFDAAHDRFLDAQERFRDYKDEEARCEGDTSTACEEWRQKTLEAAKEHLSALADKVLETIGQVRAKIEESEDLSDEDANAMLANLDELEAKVKEAKADVLAATTKAEVKEAGQDIVEAWKQVHERLIKHKAKLLNGRVQRILKSAEQLEAKLDRVLAKLETDGVEVSDLDAKVDEFSNLLDKAREEYAKGRDILAKAYALHGTDAREEIQSLIDEAQSHFRTAHNSLKSAHSLLQTIIREMNSLGGSLDDANDADELSLLEEDEEEIQEDEEEHEDSDDNSDEDESSDDLDDSDDDNSGDDDSSDDTNSTDDDDNSTDDDASGSDDNMEELSE